MAAAPEQPIGSVMFRSGKPQGRPMSAIEIDAGLQSSLYESVGKADGWATFLHALARSYSGGKSTLSVRDTVARSSVSLPWGTFESDQVAQYNCYYRLNNPWLSNGTGGQPADRIGCDERSPAAALGAVQDRALQRFPAARAGRRRRLRDHPKGQLAVL